MTSTPPSKAYPKEEEDQAEDQAKDARDHEWTLKQVAEAFPESKIKLSEDKALKDAQGLTAKEAQHRLERDGPNALTPPKRTPEWLLFLQQLINPFMLMLLVAAILSWIAFALDPSTDLNIWLGLVLFIVVLGTSFMSYWQERKTSNLMAVFSSLAPPQALVVRDGTQTEVPASDLVVGDIIMIKEGDIIPADVRILHCSSLRVETSSLTGESTPIVGTSEPAAPDTQRHEARCLGFSGSQCLQGSATAVVVRTGDDTMIGKIATSTTSAGTTKTRLGEEILSFVRFVAVLAIAMAAVFFAIGVGRQEGDNALKIFINGFLIVIVANVPQGLPATVTSQLTITAKRLAKVNVFVKRLEVVETLGSASVIASDKTGTITLNRMSVRAFWSNCVTYRDMDAHLPAAFPSSHGDSTTLHWLSTVACVCNHASRQTAKDLSEECEYIGNPSDAALLQFTDRHYHSDLRRSQFDVVAEIPFNSRNKWQMAIVRPTNQQMRDASLLLQRPSDTQQDAPSDTEMDVAMLKGAPEIVLSKCKWLMRNGEVLRIDKGMRKGFSSTLLKFGNNSWRVLGLCARLVAPLSDDEELSEDNAPSDDFVLLGLIALADPPRPNVANAVATCQKAGVRVFMVTGDHAITASAIAKEVGILRNNSGKHAAPAHDASAEEEEDDIPGMVEPGVFRSHAVDQFTDKHWKRVVSLPGAVFARATPQQKLTIVKACQRLNQIVAVTGDGVNDAPALKQADIGIAMGIKGNAVAKEAADTLLMDDNFASIVHSIEEGRLIIDNLRKTIRYILTHLMPEIFPVLINLALGLPLGLTSLQILSIDLVTEMIAGITLAYDPMEPGIMNRPPRPKNKRMVNRELLTYAYLIAGGIETVACFLAYLQAYDANGLSMSDIFLRGDDHFNVDPDPLTLGNRTFSPSEQENIAGEATAAWYMTLILSQVVHLWVVKSSTVSLFRINPLNNTVACFGVLLELCIMIILVYIPGVQDFMGASTPRGESWGFFLISGVCLIAYTELRLLLKNRRAKRRREAAQEQQLQWEEENGAAGSQQQQSRSGDESRGAGSRKQQQSRSAGESREAGSQQQQQSQSASESRGAGSRKQQQLRLREEKGTAAGKEADQSDDSQWTVSIV